MLYIFVVFVGILAIYLVFKVLSAFITFIAAIFLPMLVIIAAGFLFKSILKDKMGNTFENKGGHNYDM